MPLYVSSKGPKELPPTTPASGTKWFDNLKLLPFKWESKRLATRNDDFKRVQEDLFILILVRQLAMKATNVTNKAAPTKNNRKRDTEDETKEEGSLAKKQKLAEPRCSLSKFDTAILADGDETGPSLN